MKRDVAALGANRFDLLVVGGGIYGAWAAQDAARRGLMVALIERDDWGSGTSSASSKLIHGGLRYLEHGWIRLVRKTLAERERLIRIGPHRIRPVRFLLPIDRGGRRGALRIGIGLRLYDLLTPGEASSSPHRRLDPAELASLCGFLAGGETYGAFEFGDAVTDDARFVLETVDGAIAAGAAAANHVAAVGLLRAAAGVEGVLAEDRKTGRRFELRARMTLAAAGPWLDAPPFRPSGTPARIRCTKGVHLVLPALPTDRAILVTARADARPIFLIPWLGRTLVGTTDTEYDGPPGEAPVEDRDVGYLLGECRRALGERAWTPADIVGAFAGVRAMIASSAADPGAISREWKIEEPERGFLISVGGKLTSARADAALAVDRAVARLGRDAGPCRTSDQPFPWAPDGPFDEWLSAAVRRGESLGLDPETARVAALRHGTRVDRVHARIAAEPSLAERAAQDCPLAMAEIVHAARDEMAATTEDVLRRRVPLKILCAGDTAALAAAAARAERELGSGREVEAPVAPPPRG